MISVSDKGKPRAGRLQPLTQLRNQGQLPVGGDLSLVSSDKKELSK